MGGHLLDQPLPTRQVEQIDPFLLIHHWDKPIAKGHRQKDLGVGPIRTGVFSSNIYLQRKCKAPVLLETMWLFAGGTSGCMREKELCTVKDRARIGGKWWGSRIYTVLGKHSK